MIRPEEDDTVEFIPDIRVDDKSSPSSDLPVPNFPGYSIEGELGRGGLGVVYRARDLTLNRPVALKVLNTTPGDREEREAILQEARKAAALDDRRIVTIYGVLEHQSVSAIAMELVNGHELQNVSSVLEPRQIAKIISEVSEAITTAHQAGILHRDLKPQNIVVTPNHEVRILDFGLSIDVNLDVDEEDGFSGTIAYAAPERLHGSRATPASDIFSMGVLFHEALTGRHPFSKLGKPPTVSSILAGDPSLPREHRPEIPEDLERICMACLSYNQEDRPSSREVSAALRSFLAGQPVQLRATAVQNHLLNRIEEHVDEIERWTSLSLASTQERDQLRWQYRRILEGDDLWPTETRKIRAGELGIYFSVWAILCVSVLASGLYREEIGTPVRWLVPLTITCGFLFLSFITHDRTNNRVTPLFMGGAILSMMPTLISIFTEWLWIPESTVSTDLLRGAGVANKTIFVASLISLIASVVRLNRTGVSFFAWLASLLFISTQLSLLLMLGFLEWGDGPKALGILSTSIVWIVGTGFEMQKKPRFARPFHWLGSIGMIVGLYMLGRVPLLTWFGFTSLTHNTTFGWSMAIIGVVMLIIGSILDRSRRLERRRIAKYFEWLCPIFLIGGFYTAAFDPSPFKGWESDLATWASVAPFLLAVALFTFLTARNWRARFMVASLSGVALGLHLVQEQGLISKTGLLITTSVIGFLLIIVNYTRMELALRSTDKRSDSPLPLSED